MKRSKAKTVQKADGVRRKELRCNQKRKEMMYEIKEGVIVLICKCVNPEQSKNEKGSQ